MRAGGRRERPLGARAPAAWVLFLGAAAWAQDPAHVRELARSGRHQEAEREARTLLEKRETETGPDSNETADALDLLVQTLYAGDKGSLEDTRLHASRAVRLRERRSPPDPKLSASLGNLASCLQAAGEYAEARPYLERSVALREELVGAKNYRLAVPLNNLGHLLLASGDPAAARRVFERARDLDEGGRPSDAALAAALHGLGQALLETGNLEVARERIEEAVARSPTGESATYRVNLALVLGEMGLAAEARSQLRKAIEDSDGPSGNQRTLGSALNNLAWLEHEAGHLDEARPLYKRALDIREKALAPDPVHVAWTLRNLGLLLLERGELGEAEALLDRSLAIREALGKAHPLAGDSLLLRAKVRLARGDPARALEDALRAESLRRERVGLTSRYLSEREALSHAGRGGPLRHASRGGSALDMVLACALASGDLASARRAWDALIRSRALVLDELASRRRALASRDPEVVRRFEALAVAREKLARLFVEEGSAARAGSGKARLERAMAERDLAERSLGEASAAYRAERVRALAGYEDVARALPARAALVGLVRLLVPTEGIASEAVYAAFVRAPASSDPAFIRLAPAAEIDELAARWRDALSRKDPAAPVDASEQDARAVGERLRRRLWDPIQRILGAPDLTLVVPAGELHLVPLDALPDGDGYLAEKGAPIHYLSSERDVISPSGGEATAARGSGLLAFGAPDFGEGRAEAASAGYLRGIRFEPLPLSSDEAREAAEAWKAVRDGGEAVLLTGEAATESAFKSLAPGRRAVHLATHGFFLGSGAGASPAGSRGIGGIASAHGGATALDEPSPLLLSGVAFAGANRRSEAAAARDDGILTAEEIAGLDLSSLEWAVLSACDTGTGKLDVSEGVLGLRRAFQAAGARTLITSLWSAEDRAAHEWMREIYRARFQEGLGTAVAARNASLRVLALRRAGGRSTHPFYWAGFVAAGDWR